MTMLDGGELCARALVNEGVEKAFVLCGGHIMPIFYGMRNAGIEIIDVRHECSAVYAAIAYTRASGKPAVVVTTAGPGVGNTPAGMMEAQTLNVPLLQIGGAVAMDKRDAGDLQDMETFKLMEACSKWAKKLTSTSRIPEYVSMAFRHALDGAPGPVYLEIPTDLLARKVEESAVVFPPNYRAQLAGGGSEELVNQAAELLANAERPAIVIDDGARWSLGNDADAIAELSDYLKIPVTVTGNLCRGMFGDEAANPLLNTNAIWGADVVLALGCRFDYRHMLASAIPADARIIQVHTDMAQIGFNVRADVPIQGASGAVARQLVEKIKGTRNPKADDPWTGKPVPGAVASLPEQYSDTKVPAHPARCVGEVLRYLESDAPDWSVVMDGGESYVWFALVATASRPGQLHAFGPNGTIGSGAGQVIGAWAADRKPVLWYTGDGSFGFYGMEMETMARLGIPVICVISNNSSWGMIHMAERYARAKEVEENGPCNVALHPMRAYEKMAAMWDGYGEKVTDPEEILPALKRAAAVALEGRPAILNVEVDDESLSPMIAGYANMIKPEE